MLAKYVRADKDSLGLVQGIIYDVFSIEISGTGNRILYIKGDSKYIYPFKETDFEIIDGTYGEIWATGVNNFGETIIGPKEIFNIDNFWEKYYEDDIDCHAIVNKYLNRNM